MVCVSGWPVGCGERVPEVWLTAGYSQDWGLGSVCVCVLLVLVLLPIQILWMPLALC